MNRFGINRVILGTFDKGIDETGMNETNAAPHSFELPTPMMRTGAGFRGQRFRGQFQDGGASCKVP